MSILDTNTDQPLSAAQSCANDIREQARNTFNHMASSFNHGCRIFWNNPSATPTQIAEALGTDAKEIFLLHYALGQLINNIKPESISEGWGLIGQFTMNEDGTVTIISTSGNP